jgi:hypothetical protein
LIFLTSHRRVGPRPVPFCTALATAIPTVKLRLRVSKQISGRNVRELLIRTTTEGSHGVLVAVIDSGPGLSPAGLKRLFDSFYTRSDCRYAVRLLRHTADDCGLAQISHAGPFFRFTVPAKGCDSI